MVYVLYGLDEYLITRKIKQVIKDNNIDEISVEKYDLTDTKLEQIIDYANSSNLFNDKKVIIVSEAYIFTGNSKKNSLEHDISSLENYLNNINENTILIFKVISEKLDERKKITKLLKEKGKILELSKENHVDNLVKSFFDGYEISSLTIFKFINKVGENMPLLENEAEKLKIYKSEDKKIEEIDLDIINQTIDIDIFNLIDNIVLKKKKEAVISYNEMIKSGEEPIKILIMLANQFRLMYQTKLLYQKGYTQKDMASLLSVHPYRIKLAIEKGRGFTDNQLLKYLDDLSILDSKIKQSEIDKKMAIELFILKL